MTPFRRTITDAVQTAATAGASHAGIMADLTVTIACLIRAGSHDHGTRLAMAEAVLTGIRDEMMKDMS